MRFHRISLKIFYDGDLLSPPMLESMNGVCERSSFAFPSFPFYYCTRESWFRQADFCSWDVPGGCPFSLKLSFSKEPVRPSVDYLIYSSSAPYTNIPSSLLPRIETRRKYEKLNGSCTYDRILRMNLKDSRSKIPLIHPSISSSLFLSSLFFSPSASHLFYLRKIPTGEFEARLPRCKPLAEGLTLWEI